MHTCKTLIKLSGLVALSVFMIGFVIRVGEATTSTFTREMDGGIWRYTYEAGNGREITIAKVSVNFSKSEILDAYRRLNQQYAASLIGRTSQQPRDVDVALTFTRPLSFEEVMEIRRNTGLSAQLYTVVAMNEDDEKGTLTVVAGEDSAISMSKANEMIASQGFKFMGIMVIHGKISNSQGGLGRLLADNRIYLVDMTANRVREDLLANGEHLDQVREMYVHIPSPFWDMPWK